MTPPALHFVVRDGKLVNAPFLTVTKRSGTFEISKVDVRGLPLRASLAPVSPGKSHRVDLEYQGGWKQGLTKGTISVHTTDAKQSVIGVPVTAAASGPGGRRDEGE